MEMLRQENLNFSLGNRGQRKVSHEALQIYALQTAHGGGGERGPSYFEICTLFTMKWALNKINLSIESQKSI